LILSTPRCHHSTDRNRSSAHGRVLSEGYLTTHRLVSALGATAGSPRERPKVCATNSTKLNTLALLLKRAAARSVAAAVEEHSPPRVWGEGTFWLALRALHLVPARSTCCLALCRGGHELWPSQSSPPRPLQARRAVSRMTKYAAALCAKFSRWQTLPISRGLSTRLLLLLGTHSKKGDRMAGKLSGSHRSFSTRAGRTGTDTSTQSSPRRTRNGPVRGRASPRPGRALFVLQVQPPQKGPYSRWPPARVFV